MTRIPAPLLAEIVARAGAHPSVEVCGLLLGAGDAITGVRHAANVAPHPADSFEVDPALLLAAHRAERAGGPRLLGHYHSHPNGRPEPSARDRAAAEPGRLWLIVGGGVARLWRAERDGFTPVPIEVG